MRLLPMRVSCIAACVAVLLAPSALRGQITVTSSDITTAMKTGTRAIGYNTPNAQKVSINVGSASTGAQTWDFRTVPFTKSSDFEVIDPAAAPEHALFPAANIVLRGSVTAQPGTTMYQYNQVTQTEYLLHAVGYSGGTATYQYKPPAIQMRFPCTLGTTWTYTGDATSPGAGVTIQSTYKWTCDAHGTLRLPGGDYPALRLLTETVTTSTTPVFSSMLRSYRYNFVTKTMHGAVVNIDSSDRGASTVMASAGYQTPSGSTAVETVSPQNETLVLGTMHPQPLLSRGSVTVTIARPGLLHVSLVDMLGREAAVLANDMYTAGTHLLEWTNTGLLPGNYLCVARSADGRKAHPVVLLR